MHPVEVPVDGPPVLSACSVCVELAVLVSTDGLGCTTFAEVSPLAEVAAGPAVGRLLAEAAAGAVELLLAVAAAGAVEWLLTVPAAGAES